MRCDAIFARRPLEVICSWPIFLYDSSPISCLGGSQLVPNLTRLNSLDFRLGLVLWLGLAQGLEYGKD